MAGLCAGQRIEMWEEENGRVVGWSPATPCGSPRAVLLSPAFHAECKEK